MKKRLLSVFLVLILAVGLLPSTVFADGGTSSFIYLDAETLEPISGLFQADKRELFVIEQPNGTLFTTEGSVFHGDGWNVLGVDLRELTQLDRHKLITYPIPNGYDVVEIYQHVYDWDDSQGYVAIEYRNVEKDGFVVANYGEAFWTSLHILLRKTGNTATNQQPQVIDNTPSGFQGIGISVGAMLRWNHASGVKGYRIYRSENAFDDGVSVTDFYITCNEFVDVNIKPNKTYYYTICAVLAEAKPFDDIPEQLSPSSEKITISTVSTILGDELMPPTSNAVKKFILMTLDNPYMTLNGEQQEIDPGRGTTPILLNNRTMVPVRAIVEGMGGSVNWNDANREISLNYQQNTVKMTLDKGEFYVNGAIKTADVPATAINSRTMVPIRFAAESLGCAIDWLNSTKQVVIVYY